MIWFACQECGKRHQRPDEAAGSLVFCTCGHGNRVPWESTVPAPPPSERQPAPPRPAARPRYEEEEDEEDRRWRRGPRRRVQRHDPAYCLNHEDKPSKATCADCGEGFCADCLIAFQDKTLCGPCKNFRLRTLQRPSSLSPLSLVSLGIALVSAPVAFWLTMLTPQMHKSNSPSLRIVFAVIGLGVAGVALILGLKSLYDVEKGTKVSGAPSPSRA